MKKFVAGRFMRISKRVGVTSAEIGRRTGISQRGAYGAIAGPDGFNPTLETMRQVADALGVSLWAVFCEFLSDDDVMRESANELLCVFSQLDDQNQAVMLCKMRKLLSTQRKAVMRVG